MNIDIEKIKQCPICQKWINYCLTEPSDESIPVYKAWLFDKQRYWEENSTYLSTMGFNYEAGLCKALDFVEINKYQRSDLEGCLLIVKLGSAKEPATPQKIDITSKIMKEALEGIKGVRVIITQHDFNIEKIVLPQLRRLQSEILTSFEPEENSNPIISNLEV